MTTTKIKTFAPQLAETLDPMKDPDCLSRVNWPMWGSPKLDGIRCNNRRGELRSKSMKLLPNKLLQDLFKGWHGHDGEFIVGDPTAHDVYNKTQSVVMSGKSDKKPPKPVDDVKFWVFDCNKEEVKDLPYEQRLEHVRQEILLLDVQDKMRIVPHTLIHSLEEFLAFEEEMLELGYEGVMLNSPTSPYKWGRGGWGDPRKPSVYDQCMFKLKRFEDVELKVVGVVEAMRNTNEAFTDEMGRSKRSTSKVGLVPAGTAGTLLVEFNGEPTEVGLGCMKHDERLAIFQDPTLAVGRFSKVRHFPKGAINALRFPRHQGWRDPLDMD